MLGLNYHFKFIFKIIAILNLFFQIKAIIVSFFRLHSVFGALLMMF